MATVKKADIELSLQQEQRMIQEGKLKEDNPLDLSEQFRRLCEACRRGDLKVCQEMIIEGANINARDLFDYTPLILASLCGHYEVVQLLLESGALCERDTFQGERCLYNALNERIHKLLLSYDYSKSTDPLQPFAAHISSLLTRQHPRTSDIIVATADETFHLHKFILSGRSPYFSKKLAAAPETGSWRLPASIPVPAFSIAIRYLYFGEIPSEVGGGPGTGFSEDETLEGLDKITKQLEIRNLWDGILEAGDRRLARQRRTDEIDRGRNQLERWFRDNVLRHKFTVDRDRAEKVQWDRENGIFADVLLQSDETREDEEDFERSSEHDQQSTANQRESDNSIPIGPLGLPSSRSPSRHRRSCRSTLFPAHRAMLLRSEYFSVMFSSGFREAQNTEYLQIVPIDCSPEVLEIVLVFLYTEKTDFPLDMAIDVLFAADLLLIEKLKTKAAALISTLGNGSVARIPARLDSNDEYKAHSSGEHGQRPVVQDGLDIYDVIRAGWMTRMPRLEEFGARYIAFRLESYIDDEAFADLVRESASRIQSRQETDTIELLDDIRHYLSERFRLRFEDVGIDEMMEDEEAAAAAAIAQQSTSPPAEETKDGKENSESVSTSAINNSGSPPDHSSSDPGGHPLPSVPGTLPPPKESSTPASTSSSYPAEPITESHEQNLQTDIVIRTLDGEIAGDEMEEEAMNYQILLGKIERLLERLRLDA